MTGPEPPRPLDLDDPETWPGPFVNCDGSPEPGPSFDEVASARRAALGLPPLPDDDLSEEV